MERIPVPHPTSRTTLSLKMCLFWTMAFMYDLVRTSSFCSGACHGQRSELGLPMVVGPRVCTYQHLLVDAFVAGA